MKSKRLIFHAHSRTLKTILTKNKFTNLKIKPFVYKTLLKPIWTFMDHNSEVQQKIEPK